MSRAEDRHQHAKAAKQQRVERAAERPPRAQAQKGKEVHGRGEGGQHDACKTTQSTNKHIDKTSYVKTFIGTVIHVSIRCNITVTESLDKLIRYLLG